MHSPHNKLFNVVEAKFIEFLNDLLERTTSFAGDIEEQAGIPKILRMRYLNIHTNHSKSAVLCLALLVVIL